MSAGVLRHTLVVRHPDTGIATAVLAGEPVPAWAEDLVHEDDLQGGGDDDKSYASLKEDALEALVAERNEGREEADLIEVGGKGTVKDLVAALEADDAKKSDS